MKTQIIFAFILSLASMILKAQSFLDPYKNHIGTLPQSVPTMVGNATNPNSLQYLLDEPEPISGGYTGEYMICLNDHFWHIDPDLQNKAKSYKVEIVSFPFTMNCFDVNGCAVPHSQVNQRTLTMPDDAYNSNNKKWGELCNIVENGLFSTSGDFIGGITNATHKPEALVSTFFHILHSGYVDERNLLPHTVTKHTIFLHSTNDPGSSILNQFSFYYDNTRGRMRYYPFLKDNNPISNVSQSWDVVFRPELIFDPFEFVNYPGTYNYCNLDNLSWISGGTINYFPLALNNTSFNCISDYIDCSLPFATRKNGITYSGKPTDFEYDGNCPPPYSLYDTYLRNTYGNLMAGYYLDANTNELKFDGNLNSSSTGIYEGIKHEYFIDKGYPDLDLSLINAYDKIIYNPSEVTLDPDNGIVGTNPPIDVIFPENYTFKTILGRYPSYQEVIDASNDPQNGYYTDMRDIPVPVDAATRPWTTSNADDYPELMWDNPMTTDINGFYSDERFGYYYIENKATLTIASCVKLFDARFAVNSGGTMRFNDYSQILGYEDKANNNGRYKIRGEGGAILRNFSQVQYVQNGDIFQSVPLHYIATSHIIAGENVDPDADQPTGIYEIKAGADVTFTAGDYIHLTDGFFVSGGNFHAVINENLPVPVICYDNSGQNGGNRVQQQTGSPQAGTSNFINLAPSPNHGFFAIDINGFNSISAVSLFDLSGRIIYHKTELHEKSHEVLLPPNNKGLMIVKIVDNNGQTQMKKVMVE
ncbi:MAG: T9SS sorting signal type C domain-containing protein [Arcticibacter sp.]